MLSQEARVSGQDEEARAAARANRTLPLAVAAARVALVGEHLLAESSAQGGARVSLGADQLRFLPSGRLELAPPAADEPRSEDPRELSYLLGALLYTWLVGAPPPRRATMAMAHERALRRALGASGLDLETVELLRRLLAWDPARRPWPELVVAQLRARLPEEEPAADGDDVAEDVPTELAPESPAELTVEVDQATAEAAFDADEQDARRAALNAPVTLEPEEGELDAEDPFSIPDQAAVVPFPWPGAPYALEEDEATDPEIFRAAGLSEDERTDPELAHLEAAHLEAAHEEAAHEEADEAAAADVSPDEPTRLRAADPPALTPSAAPAGVRLAPPPASPSPARLVSARVTAPRSRAPLWIGLAVLLTAIAVGAALAG